MTEAIPRKPGRPPGSSRLNKADAFLLQQVAAKVLAMPALTNRAAILQVIGGHNPSGLRRLQSKFHRTEMVAEAKARATAAEQAQRAAAQKKLEAIRVTLDFLNGGPSFQKAFQEFQATSPIMQALDRRLRDGSIEQTFERVLKDLEQSPFMQALAALQRAAAASPNIPFGWPSLSVPDKRLD